MIYFFRDSGTGYHKIGYTSNDSPNERLSSCQTGNPNKLTVTGIMPGSQQYERDLHSKYARYKVHNEWFSLAEEQVISIILENNGEVYSKGYEEEKNWLKRVKMIKERFSSLSSLVYKGDDTIPLLSDEQIKQLDAQVSRVQNAIKDGMKDNEEVVKSTCVERKTAYYYTDKEEKKTYAVFQVSPKININLLLDKPTEEYIEDLVNKRFINRYKFFEEAMTSAVEENKKDANKSIVNLLEYTEEQLEEKKKEVEELKNKIKELEANNIQTDKKVLKEAMMKALESM